MKSTGSIEDYFSIGLGKPWTQAPYLAEEILDYNPALFIPAARRHRALNKAQQSVKSLEKHIHEWEEDMKENKWFQLKRPPATAGVACSIVKGTTQLVDELVALKFVDTGEAPESPTPSSQIRPNSAIFLATKSPQAIGNNLIPAVDNAPNATTPNPSLRASSRWPSPPPPLPPPRPLPDPRIDNGWFLKCRNCATTFWDTDCDFKDLCRQYRNLKIPVSHHSNYAAKYSVHLRF